MRAHVPQHVYGGESEDNPQQSVPCFYPVSPRDWTHLPSSDLMAGTLNHWATSLTWLLLLIFGCCCCLCGLTYLSWSPLLSDKEGPCYLNRSFLLKQSQKKGRHLHYRSPCAIASFSTSWLPQCVGQTEVKVLSVAPPISQVSLVMQTSETKCSWLPV